MCSSRRNVMQVSSRPHAYFSADFIFSIQGFLPVLYTFLRSLSHSPSPQSQDDHPTPKLQPLAGWRCTFLWFPALCDLAGTTVRSKSCLPHWSQLTPSSVNEHRSSLHASLNLSDDPRISRPIRRRSQRLIPSPPSLAISVLSLSRGPVPLPADRSTDGFLSSPLSPVSLSSATAVPLSRMPSITICSLSLILMRPRPPSPPRFSLVSPSHRALIPPF